MKEFESIKEFKDYLINLSNVSDIAVQSLDLTRIENLIISKTFKDCIFLGCKLTTKIQETIQKDNYIFPTIEVPFNIYPNRLYSKNSLFNGYDPKIPDSYENTLDKIIYNHYIKTGKESSIIKETLARRLHDHSITDSLQEFLSNYDEKMIVAVMGGHGLSRDNNSYRQIAEISKSMTESGYILVSGGGPGAMEATHLGAWFADKSNKELEEAIKHLSLAPKYNHPNWLPTAFEILKKYPSSKYKSLGIPTWLYGHEPPTPFATHIAKYFANSVREEGLLAIAKGGVIFAPGSAGTMQEVFQDIAQNHYKSFGYASPMVFLNKKYWSYDRPVYPIIELMKLRGNLKNLDIGLYDKNEEIINHLQSFI
jgi:predicted Rossmann-fold nucleotide-binding protein